MFNKKAKTMTEAYEQFSSVVAGIKETQEQESKRLEEQILAAKQNKSEADREVSLAQKALENMQKLFGM